MIKITLQSIKSDIVFVNFSIIIWTVVFFFYLICHVQVPHITYLLLLLARLVYNYIFELYMQHKPIVSHSACFVRGNVTISLLTVIAVRKFILYLNVHVELLRKSHSNPPEVV